jgi:hypothetical protein
LSADALWVKVNWFPDCPLLGDCMAKRSGGLSAERLRELARSSAADLLGKLRTEVIAIEQTFPELALPQKRRAARKAIASARKRTRRMSADARKAVSERMKKYWAARRKAQTKTTKS